MDYVGRFLRQSIHAVLSQVFTSRYLHLRSRSGLRKQKNTA